MVVFLSFSYQSLSFTILSPYFYSTYLQWLNLSFLILYHFIFFVFVITGIYRRNPPSELSNRATLMTGLLTVFKCKIKDEEVAKACSDLLLRVLDGHPPPSLEISERRTRILLSFAGAPGWNKAEIGSLSFSRIVS